MAKKRSCRRSAEEDRQHDIAVSVRKMTDKQICTHLEMVRKEAWDKGHDAGYMAGYDAAGKEENRADKGVEAFLKAIQLAKIKGVGVSTISKIMVYAQENGYAV